MVTGTPQTVSEVRLAELATELGAAVQVRAVADAEDTRAMKAHDAIEDVNGPVAENTKAAKVISDAAGQAWLSAHEQVRRLEAEIIATPATTIAGLRMKASLWKGDEEIGDEQALALVRSLHADLARMEA